MELKLISQFFTCSIIGAFESHLYGIETTGAMCAPRRDGGFESHLYGIETVLNLKINSRGALV